MKDSPEPRIDTLNRTAQRGFGWDGCDVADDTEHPFAEAWFQAFGVTKKPPPDTETRPDGSRIGAETCKPAGLRVKKKNRIQGMRILG